MIGAARHFWKVNVGEGQECEVTFKVLNDDWSDTGKTVSVVYDAKFMFEKLGLPVMTEEQFRIYQREKSKKAR